MNAHHHWEFDPWRFNLQTVPRPTEGELPPPLCLVDEDGPFLRVYPVWMRALAGIIALVFLASSTVNGLAIWGIMFTPHAQPESVTSYPSSDQTTGTSGRIR